MRAPTAAPRRPAAPPTSRIGRRVPRAGRARAPPPASLSQGAARDAATAAEDEANKKRWQESGGGQGSADEWRWTLNWDPIVDGILVGSCPRSAADVATIAAATRATAILCLQSDDCLTALNVDIHAVQAAARAAGMVHARVAVRDFDRADQILMLPEAVRTLALLRSLGHTVYVHCTAGINRATLTVVGYLTFVEGASLDAAVAAVTSARPQARPYLDCWKAARRRMLDGRADEVGAAARALFEARGGAEGDDDDGGVGDWVAAEAALLTRASARQTAAVKSVVDSVLALARDDADKAVAAAEKAMQAAEAAATAARAEAAAARAEAASARATLAALDGGAGWSAALDAATADVAALQEAVADVVDAAEGALKK